MDSEWRKTPKVHIWEGSRRFWKVSGQTEKVRNILEGGGTGPAGPAPPGEAHKGWPAKGQGPSRVGEEESLPPSMRVGKEGGLPPPHFLLVCPLSFHIVT